MQWNTLSFHTIYAIAYYQIMYALSLAANKQPPIRVISSIEGCFQLLMIVLNLVHEFLQSSLPRRDGKSSGFRFFQTHNGMTWSVCLLRIFFRDNWSNFYVLIFQDFTGKFILRVATFIRQLINAIFTTMINQIRHKFCQCPSPGWAANLIVNYCQAIMILSQAQHRVNKVFSVFAKDPWSPNNVIVSHGSLNSLFSSQLGTNFSCYFSQVASAIFIYPPVDSLTFVFSLVDCRIGRTMIDYYWLKRRSTAWRSVMSMSLASRAS